MNLDPGVEAALQEHFAYYASGVCGIGRAEASMSFKAVFCKGWNDSICDEIINQLNAMVDSGIFNTGLSRNILGFTKLNAAEADRPGVYNPGGIAILWDEAAQFDARLVPDSLSAVASGAFDAMSNACTIRFAGVGPRHGSTLKTELGGCYVQLFRSNGFVPVLVMMMLYYIVCHRREDCIVVNHQGYPDDDDDMIWQCGRSSLWDQAAKWSERNRPDWKQRRADMQSEHDTAVEMQQREKKAKRQKAEAARRSRLPPTPPTPPLPPSSSSSSAAVGSLSTFSSSSAAAGSLSTFSSSSAAAGSLSTFSSSAAAAAPNSRPPTVQRLSFKEAQEQVNKWREMYPLDEITCWGMISGGESGKVHTKSTTAAAAAAALPPGSFAGT